MRGGFHRSSVPRKSQHSFQKLKRLVTEVILSVVVLPQHFHPIMASRLFVDLGVLINVLLSKKLTQLLI